MKRLTLSALVLAALAASGCPKQEAVTTATPIPSATPEPKRGVVDVSVVPKETMLKAANGWHGTYKNLLTVLYDPEDEKQFTQFSEFGWKDPFPYKEYGAMPAGWWVYVAPFWFVWDTRDGQREATSSAGAIVSSDGKIAPAGERNGFVDPATVPGRYIFRAALGKTDARYSNLLAVIQDPDDVKEYSKWSEYGWQPARDYKTYGKAPAGFWVYVEPYWVIWNLRDGKTGP